MGDRANIVMTQHRGTAEQGGAELFLYTHWGGHKLPETLQAALIHGRARWDDESYLARIIFDEMVGANWGKLSGFGLSTYPCDNEHDYLVVDCEKQEVRREHEATREAIARWPFEAFCALDIKTEFRDF